MLGNNRLEGRHDSQRWRGLRLTVVSHTYDAAGQKGLLSTTTDANGRILTYSDTARYELSQVSEAAGRTVKRASRMPSR